ncbi:hypothetical protein [Mangrovimonas xylaniphaga]|uniref:hypothetical protein n=1 Tax=Mangrovimonas xylaniphaga TaxID=1645915 RepID=UPI0006B56B7D|nr:hypothetical protein [Mangrovimonas xylaniphaga]
MSNAVIITVSLKNSQSSTPKLKLKDSEEDSGDNDLTTDVSPGANVTWVPDFSSGISSISITKKPDSPSDFLTNMQTFANGNVQATVASNATNGSEETYSIGFTIDGDSASYSDDPKLKINN